MESNSVNNFYKGFSKEHFCQIGPIWPSGLRDVKEIVHDAQEHQVILKAPLEHIVLI